MSGPAPGSAPDIAGWGRQEQRALAAVAAQFWINGMVYAAIVSRLPDLRDRLSIDVATLGLVLTIGAFGGLFGSALGGPAIARFGTKRCIIVATILTLATVPIVGLTRSVVVLTVALAALSMFDVVTDIGMNIQGSRLSGRRSKPVMNRLHGLWSLGTVIGGLVAVRASGAGLPLWAHMLAVSCLLAVTLAFTARLLLATDEPPDTASSDQSPAASETAVTGDLDGSSGGSSPVSRLGLSLMLGSLAGAAVIMELTTSDWAAFRLADDLGVEPGRVALGFVAFTSGMVTGRFAGDSMQSLIGPEALVRVAAALAAVGILLATVVPAELVSELGVSVITPTVVAIVGFYVAALGVSVIFPQLYDRAARAPGPAGSGLAALTAGTRLAGLSAPLVVGLLADTSLSVGSAIALVTIPC
ncbi:MAG: MFS transporter, partial [Acidimicrobiales bacterium]